MILSLADRMQQLPVSWVRTTFCFSFVCLCIVVFVPAICLARLAAALLRLLDLTILEERLSHFLTGHQPDHAAS